ncbi:SRPBCC family protein [bacterium]|nr:SRPBCC family protein [bacterium]
MSETLRLHRVLATSPDRLYRAFLEADALVCWLPPHGYACTVHELDARVGGRHSLSFRNFSTGETHSFGGEYLELVPGERIVYTDNFEDPHIPGETRVTVMLRAVSCGTEMTIEQAGLPEMFPLDACYLGWQQSVEKLIAFLGPNLGE